MRKKPKEFEHLCKGCPNEHRSAAWCEEYGECPPDRRADWAVKLSFLCVCRGIDFELSQAVAKYAPMHSAHEGYAVLLEEMDELWEEVRAKDDLRDTQRMRQEAIQVAAMAIRFVLDVCDKAGDSHDR